jgi:hypothetical protein
MFSHTRECFVLSSRTEISPVARNGLFPNKLHKVNISFHTYAYVNQHSTVVSVIISKDHASVAIDGTEFLIVVVPYRDVVIVSFSCRLQSARSNLKQRVESYRKLIV